MAQSIIGKKRDAFNGLTQVIAANALRIRNVGKVVSPGRIRAFGAMLGANGTPANAKFAAYRMETVWTPDLLSPSVWFKADAITGLANGAAVSSWVNSGSTGIAAANGTGAEQPLYITNGRNGLPVVRFDGVDDDLQANSVNIPSAASIFIALKHPVHIADDQRPYVTTGNKHMMRYYNNTLQRVLVHQNGTNVTEYTGIEYTGWHVHRHIYYGDNVTLNTAFLDGGIASGSAVSTAASTASNIVLGGTGASLWADMDLGEIVVIPSVISLADQQRMEGWLAWKWGVTLAPTHPYYLYPPLLTLDENNLDPSVKLIETAPFAVPNLWTSDGAGGVTKEASALYWSPVFVPGMRLSADAITGLADNTVVATWQDSFSKQSPSFQPTAANQPTFQTNELGALPTVRFDGSNDYLTILSTLGLTQPYTVIVVWKPSAAVADQVVFQSFGGSGSQPLLWKTGANLQMNGGTAISLTPTFGGWLITHAVFNGATSLLANNGVQVTGDGGLANPLKSIMLGISVGLTAPLSGDIAEIIFTDSVFSADDIFRHEALLARKWGIGSVLPATHPYKNDALLPSPAIVYQGQQIGFGFDSDQSLRTPAPVLSGGKFWEQGTTNLFLSSPVVPTVETVDNREAAGYLVIEENRPPVISNLSPSNGDVTRDVTPDFSFVATDPDRTDGYSDYIASVIIRAWEMYNGSLRPAGSRTFTPANPGAGILPQIIGANTAVWTPAVLGTIVSAWFKADAIVGVADGAGLATWIDSSGNARNATQATGANQPIYRSVPSSVIAWVLLTIYGTLGSGTNPQFNTPAQVAKDSAGNIYIADTLNNRVMIITNGGAYIASFVVTAVTGVAVDSSGNIYVTTAEAGVGLTHVRQYNASRVLQWQAVGDPAIHICTDDTFVYYTRTSPSSAVMRRTVAGGSSTLLVTGSGSGNGQFGAGGPWGICYFASELYVVDPGNSRVEVFNLSGVYQRQWAVGTGARGIAPDLSGHILVAEYGSNTVTRYSTTGVLVDRFTQATPEGIAVTTGDVVFVSNVSSSNIAKWDEASVGTSIVPVVEFDGTNDSMATPLSASIYDETIFAVVKVDAFTTFPTIIGPNLTGGRAFGFSSTSVVRMLKVGDTAITDARINPAATWMVVEMQLRATPSLVMGINDVPIISATTPNTFTAALTSIIGAGVGASFFDGMMAEIISIPTSLLSLADERRFIAYLLKKYAITTLAGSTIPTYVTDPKSWSAFTPADLGNRPSSWLPADQITGVANGAALATWQDRSGNGVNAVQATGANQPIYRTAQVNSLPAVDFDGTDDNMVLSLLSSVDEAVFMVIKPDVIAGASRTLFATDVSGGRTLYINSSAKLILDKAGIATIGITVGSVSVGSWSIIGMILTDAALRLSINGSAENFLHSQTIVAGTASVLGANVGGSASFDGEIAELIRIPASELRPGDEERIIGGLAWKYGLTGSLVTGHPYKTLQPGLRAIPGAPLSGVSRYEETTFAGGVAASSWTDSGPSGLHAVQATPANQPTARANALNGKRSVVFDGTTDYLTTTVSASSLDRFFFAIIKVSNYAASTRSIFGSSIAGGISLVIDTIGRLQLYKYSVATIAASTGVIPLDTWTIVYGILTPTTWELGINGVRDSSGTHAQTLTGGAVMWIGAGLAVSNVFRGEIATGVVGITSNLGVNGIERIVGKMAHDWGLQSTLPDTHRFRFEYPGGPVEHHWTVEARDEIGGITGTGYGARSTDSDVPDGTSQFFTSMSGYAITAVPYSGQKLYSRTPAMFQATYDHPLGIAAVLVKVRFLKRSIAGTYEQDQESVWWIIGSNLLPGFILYWYWGYDTLEPLEFGAFYAVEWKILDANGQESDWTGRQYFYLNMPPNKAIINAPIEPAVVTGFPTILFSVDDVDDVGVAYFPATPSLIWELSWGSLGSANGSFNGPRQVHVGPSGNVFVADQLNARAQKFSPDGTHMLSIVDASGNGAFGVAEDGAGNIYISNKTTTRVRRYSSTGVFGLESIFTNHALQFLAIYSAISRLYVTTANEAIWYSMDIPTITSLITSSTGTGESALKNGVGIAVNQLNGDVYVADSVMGAVRKYVGGVLVDFWGNKGMGKGEFNHLGFSGPYGLWIHPLTGNLWVVESYRQKIMEFTKSGVFIGEYGSMGNTAGTFQNPMSVAFNKDGSKAYVTDSVNQRVQRFRIPTEADFTAKGVAGEVRVRGPITVANQDFESSVDASDWTAAQGVAWSTAFTTLAPGASFKGKQFARYTLNTGGPTIPGVNNIAYLYATGTNPNEFEVVEGEIYGFSAKFRRFATSIYARVAISWLLPASIGFGIISRSFGPIIRPTVATWQQASVSDVAPSGAARARIELWVGIDSTPTYPVIADWDDVQIDDGVRYVRGATFISGNDYTYNLTAIDAPVKGVYCIEARGRDASSEGAWSEPRVINYVDGPTATLLTPTSGQVFNTATPTFSWIITSGSQWAYKVEVTDVATGLVVYSSDWVNDDTARSHTVPSGYLQDNGSYLGSLMIDNGIMQVAV